MKLIRAGLIAVASAFLGLASVGPSGAQMQDDLGNIIRPPNGHVDAQGNRWVPDRYTNARPAGHWHNGPRYGRHWRKHNRHWRQRYHRPRSNFYFEFNVPSSRYVAPRRVIRGSRAHIRWCHDRYRSYRVRDNSWQPYHGPRRQCRSPYM